MELKSLILSMDSIDHAEKMQTLEETKARALCTTLGIPYWKDDRSYPKGKISDDEWRWEFLRRDPDYKEDWFKLCCGEASKISPERLIEYGLIQLQDPTKSYRQLNGKILFQAAAILDNQGNLEWGYYDIDDKQDKDIYRALEAKRDLDAVINVQLDLTRPLAPQIDRLKKPLDKKQKDLLGKVLRHRGADDIALYLRTADALIVNVGLTDIGKTIFNCATNPSAATRGRQAKNKLKKFWQNF